MKIVTMTETIINENGKKINVEKLKSDDLRLIVLKSRNSTNQWGILGYYYYDKCSQTKRGYMVTEYTLLRKDNKEIIKREFDFN